MRIKALGAIVALTAVPFGTCLRDAAAVSGNDPPIPCEAVDSIGNASMSADGTITLRVRSLWPQPFAETTLVYAPGDAQYGMINAISAASRPDKPSRCRRCAAPIRSRERNRHRHSRYQTNIVCHGLVFRR
jgi:hypothetical protein